MSQSFLRHLLSGALLTFCLLIEFCASPSSAQITQGSISVSVTDQNGAMVTGADLALQDLATNTTRAGSTGSSGGYTFPALSTGAYRLTVTKSGFETQVFESITVSATRITEIKATLKIGSVSQQVVVSAEGVQVLETDSNAITGTIDMKQVEGLPLMRSWFVANRRHMPLLPVHTQLRRFLLAEGKSLIDGIERDYGAVERR